MTNTAHPIEAPTRLYDQTLRQLELGKTASAILTLAGIFDGAVAAGGDVAAWRKALIEHPLFGVLTTLTVGGDPTIDGLGSSQAAASRQTLTNRALSNSGGTAEQLFAVDSPDSCDAVELADALTALRDQLSPSGRLFISSFVPSHFGLGWQRIFGGVQLHCHDEQSLEAAASVAGLSIQHFRDASDCLVWAVLQRRAPHENGN
jgi:hypothetical protein